MVGYQPILISTTTLTYNIRKITNPACAHNPQLPDFAPCEVRRLDHLKSHIVQRPYQLVWKIGASPDKGARSLRFLRGMALAISSSSRGHPDSCLTPPLRSRPSPPTENSYLAQDRSSFSKRCGCPTSARHSTSARSSNSESGSTISRPRIRPACS